MNYEKLYRDFCKFLINAAPTSTNQITKNVKEFFKINFEKNYHVLCSGQNTVEYLCDVLVTNFNPKEIISKNALDAPIINRFVYLAVESELGGTGGSSPYGVMKNVIEDFLKLLIINSHYRVLVFTSLPYKSEFEVDHVSARINTLRSIYDATMNKHSGMLLIHLAGTQPRSTQVQAVAGPESLRGFIFGLEAGSVNEITTAS